MEVNKSTEGKRGIKISTILAFDFHFNDCLLLFPFLIWNPNTIMNEKLNEGSKHNNE